MNLLSVDFDFFFPKVERVQDGKTADGHNVFFLYDWGHKESPLFIEAIWPVRAAGFLSNGLPLPKTTGEEKTFWNRFAIKPRTTVYVAESHSQIVNPRVMRNIDAVYSFDAHHDAGYGEIKLEEMFEKGRVFCDTWAVWYHEFQIPVRVLYPRWRAYAMDEDDGESKPKVAVERQVDDGQPVDLTFGRVFICRSGAWVPPWVDEDFFAFMDTCPAKRKRILGKELQPRKWKEYAEQDVVMQKKLAGIS